jgi:glycosyltransferase involved in cell wall biosynthesis
VGPTSTLPELTGRRVLHVVQKYSSGVGSAIAQYTHSLPEMEHHLLSGTPVDAEGDLAEQARFAGAQQMTGSHLDKVRRVREVVRQLRPDVVHAHSSHGGVYARLAVRRSEVPLVYTPHCYAFERRDVGGPVRSAFWLAEAVLAVNTSAFAACAQREWELSDWPTRHAPRHLVPNIAPAGGRPRAVRRAERPLVAGGGRLSPQKDPVFFLAAVHRLRSSRPDLRAVWLGDGPAEERAALEAGGIEVSGWLPRGEAMAVLAEADLYLHSARWEGFPLMVAEAAALGVPTLVRRLPSFTGVPPALTLTGVDDLAGAVACLTDPAVAASNASAWAAVLSNHTVADQRAALIEVYGRQVGAGHEVGTETKS